MEEIMRLIREVTALPRLNSLECGGMTPLSLASDSPSPASTAQLKSADASPLQIKLK
jgi:hypothetical protein